jgi:hypothetical protein
MTRLTKLLETYSTGGPTTSSYLDGRYVNLALARYKGLSPEPVTIRITEEKPYMDPKDGWVQRFKTNWPTTPFYPKLDPNYPDLIRVVIEIERRETPESKAVLMTRHSNLLVIESSTKRVFRFEPMANHKYRDIINDELKRFVAPLGYAYSEVDGHPQTSEADRGMCIAYTLKYAAMYIANMELDFYEDPSDILRFAGAIERTYTLPEGSMLDVETGGAAVAGGAGVGLLVAGIPGALIGGAIGAVASRPTYVVRERPVYRYY